MITIAALDFSTKQERAVTDEELAAALASGHYCWVDIDCAHCPEQGSQCGRCEKVLRTLGISDVVLREVLGPDCEGRYDVYDDCLHFAVTEAKLVENRLQTAHVDVVLGEHYLVTYRRREADFVKQMRRTYREDFHKFARTPGFLLYEVGDYLIESYRRTLRGFQASVEQVQLQLFGQVDDEIFRHVAELTQDILLFRKVVLASRELMHELATRRSPFVSETTQPFLGNMAGTLERLGGDLTTEREVLNETLNLYMGMVSHRTNKVVNRLTVISVIFLPLSFLCGVYGVNLQGVPEFSWKYGYAFFWGLCLIIAVSLMIFMRRRKWL
jgi:magnesium transporter